MAENLEKKLATTKVSGNNSTVVPDVVRTSEDITAGDTLEWYLTERGWIIVPERADSSNDDE
ncbi:AbrB/MazE/SpoVT family DNA-binding domain-containing protein [Halopelagius longus]|uniref:AbrB/MazE/SpoVT family DNA-binding domain-containing protein n=1 Tax=Halopelagius longus TaxID=1236180 RepID=A0A1H1FJW7_9EURY|nr:AbrB/MazE/SpoVT family DNA-binding domain-containing protein [Halopelagius longus]RDI70074.1 AbrB/MazE/SpoVT family DNA-binding domain-containing protein [Halopelagius longus]SDR01029.1 hypothetical protein SAMN05216278_3244 [Halopelagius longus]